MTSPHRLAPALPWVIAVVAFLCVAVGSVASFAAAAQIESHEETLASDPWRERGVFSYEPLLADGSGALAIGEPGYFTHDAPTVRIRFAWSIEDAGAERVTALGSLRLRIHGEPTAGRPAWTHEEEITNATLTGFAREALVLEGTIDWAAAQTRAQQTPGRQAAGAQWTILASVRFATTPDASHASSGSLFEMPVAYTPPLYVLPPAHALGQEKDHTQRTLLSHAEPAGPRALARAPLAPAMAIVGLVTLPWAVRSIHHRPCFPGAFAARRAPLSPPPAPPQARPAFPSPASGSAWFPTGNTPRSRGPQDAAASAWFPAGNTPGSRGPQDAPPPPPDAEQARTRQEMRRILHAIADADAQLDAHRAQTTQSLDELHHLVTASASANAAHRAEVERRWEERLDEMEARLAAKLRRATEIPPAYSFAPEPREPTAGWFRRPSK